MIRPMKDKRILNNKSLYVDKGIYCFLHMT